MTPSNKARETDPMGYRVVLSYISESTGFLVQQKHFIILANMQRKFFMYETTEGSIPTLREAVQRARRVKVPSPRRIWNFVKIIGPRGGEYKLTHNGVKRV